MFLEADNELHSRQDKLRQILNIYQMILKETEAICRNTGSVFSSKRNLNASMVGRL